MTQVQFCQKWFISPISRVIIQLKLTSTFLKYASCKESWGSWILMWGFLRKSWISQLVTLKRGFFRALTHHPFPFKQRSFPMSSIQKLWREAVSSGSDHWFWMSPMDLSYKHTIKNGKNMVSFAVLSVFFTKATSSICSFSSIPSINTPLHLELYQWHSARYERNDNWRRISPWLGYRYPPWN